MAKELVEQQEKQLVAIETIDFEADSGAGFEATTAADYSVPYITILQKLSPQIDDDSTSRIPDASSGMMFNTGTEQLLNKDGLGILVVPVYYEKVFVQWVPRSKGGGFKGVHHLESDIVQKAITANGGSKYGELLTEDGDGLSETARFFCLLLDGTTGAVSRVVISMSSTQLKKAKKLLDKSSSIMIKGSKGFFNPPLFSHVYRFTSLTESNDQGSWKGWKTDVERMLDMTKEEDVSIYKTAKAFKELVASGNVKVQEATQDAPAYNEDAEF